MKLMVRKRMNDSKEGKGDNFTIYTVEGAFVLFLMIITVYYNKPDKAVST